MGEDILERLARLAREERETERERLGERWDQLSAGLLPAEEIETLRKEATRSDDARRALEAFEPFDAGFRARVVETLRAELPADDAGAGLGADLSDSALFDLQLDHDTIRTVPRSERWSGPWLRWPAAAAAVAAALAAVLVFNPGRPTEPWPVYVATLTGGVEELRGEEPAVSDTPLLRPGTALEIVLRPERATPAPPEVATFLETESGLAAWPAPAEVDPVTGAVRIRGRLGQEIELPEGEVTLLVAVGEPGELPASDELARRLAHGQRTAGERWAGWRWRVLVRGDP